MSFHHQLRRGLFALPMLCLLTAGFFSVRFAPQPEPDALRAQACLYSPQTGAGIAG